jgi:hypothetical protein
VVASDKLFFWLFQERTERLLPLVTSLLADMENYTFTAPVIMEAQMAAKPDFFLRLYNESSLLLWHQHR